MNTGQDSCPIDAGMLPDDIESDAESCCSDFSSVHSVGNVSLVTDAENSEDDRQK